MCNSLLFIWFYSDIKNIRCGQTLSQISEELWNNEMLVVCCTDCSVLKVRLWVSKIYSQSTGSSASWKQSRGSSFQYTSADVRKRGHFQHRINIVNHLYEEGWKLIQCYHLSDKIYYKYCFGFLWHSVFGMWDFRGAGNWEICIFFQKIVVTQFTTIALDTWKIESKVNCKCKLYSLKSVVTLCILNRAVVLCVPSSFIFSMHCSQWAEACARLFSISFNL